MNGQLSCLDGRIVRYEQLVEKADRIIICGQENQDPLV